MAGIRLPLSVWRKGLLFLFHVAAKSHSVEDSKLMLISGEPAPQVNGPASYADAHLAAISKELEPKLGYHIYLVPVSGFLDEGPDNAVQA